ncbi:hypothetical protein [Vallicoccus soli]|uniref:tRNA adenosine deaminase-associated protein n=1 Tax=Vallicoccus soli TaxID=2339232 RepID=UPI00140408CB|nr:hypothetical protein [Vallicoccus soli]
MTAGLAADRPEVLRAAPPPGAADPAGAEAADGADGADGAADFALAAWREDGAWSLAPLPPCTAGHLPDLLRALRQLPADAGALGLVSLADSTFLLVRVGGGETRLLVADPEAAEGTALGREAVDALVDAGADLAPEDDPWLGDLGLLADLGLEPAALRSLCEDDEAYPDELLGVLAEHLGLGPAYEAALDAT